MAKNRIRWTQAEQQALYDHLATVLADDVTMSTIVALDRAQAVLPEQRRRKIGHDVAHRYGEQVREVRLRVMKTARAAQEAIDAAAAPTERKGDPKESLGEVLDRLVEVLAERVAERVLAKIGPVQDLEPNRTFTRVKHDPTPVSDDRPPRVGVLVIGLLGGQIEALPKFKGLDIEFMTSEQAMSRPFMRRAYTVVMTKFISHSVQDKYQKAPKMVRCTGGVSELVKLLREIESCDTIDKVS